MKLSQLRQIIREEAKSSLNEGPLTNAIKPAYTGDLGTAVKALEEYLITVGDKYQWRELADLVADIIHEARMLGGYDDKHY